MGLTCQILKLSANDVTLALPGTISNVSYSVTLIFLSLSSLASEVTLMDVLKMRDDLPCQLLSPSFPLLFSVPVIFASIYVYLYLASNDLVLCC